MINKQVVYDAMHLRPSDFARVQQELGVTFHKGCQEDEKDFRTRVLTEIDNQGNLRLLEQLLSN